MSANQGYKQQVHNYQLVQAQQPVAQTGCFAEIIVMMKL
jgi:hypothetical protein